MFGVLIQLDSTAYFASKVLGRILTWFELMFGEEVSLQREPTLSSSSTLTEELVRHQG